MTTPAPHVPVSFLKSGGSQFFSERCQEALIKAGLNPDWFGSYDYVAKRTENSRKKIARWNSMTPAEQARRPELRPTPEDRHLANCTSSHLVQDGCYRNARVPGTPVGPPPIPVGSPGAPGRGDPCASLVDGYVEGNAPAFPAEGRAGQAGSMENLMDNDEKTARHNQARANQPGFNTAATGTMPTPNTYPSGQLTADENARSSVIANNQVARFNANQSALAAGGLPPGSTQTLAGSGPGGRAATPGEVAQFGNAVGAKPPATPPSKPSRTIDASSGTAEDCINAWREKAKREMMTTGLKSEITRTQKEGTPAAQAAANARVARATTREANARARSAATTPGTDAHARAEAKVESARLERVAAERAQERTQTAAARLPCLQNMQANVRGGSPNTNGRTFA